jgi:hypothetical protein
MLASKFVPCAQLCCSALPGIPLFLALSVVVVGATKENWKEVVGMTSDWITIFTAIVSTPLGEWLRRGNELW